MKTSRALKASRSLREGFVKASRRLQPYPRRLREGFAKAPRAPPFGNDSSDNDKPPKAKRATGRSDVNIIQKRPNTVVRLKIDAAMESRRSYKEEWGR